jgi:tRNA (guanine-N7-)-methyltransferase
MRLRHKKNAEADILNSPFCIHVGASTDTVGASTDTVGANACGALIHASFASPTNPLHLELGMGKGKFIIELAKQNPDINYIGIERSATIVLKAIDNLVGASPDNLRFMCLNVELLENVFMPHSIDKIYLNFSDPWPKKRHESRRLTHNRFLSIYEKLLKPGSLLEFKTDNVGLFDFSLEEIKNSNFKLLEYTYDLHNNKKLNKNNIMTEYEAKFSKLGNKICKLIAKI